MSSVSADISVHENEVADAAAHDKKMENLMGTKVFMDRVKYRELQCVDNAADRIDDTAGQKPSECSMRKCIPKCAKHRKTGPAHCNIDDRGEPLRAGDPAGFGDHSDDGNAPDES